MRPTLKERAALAGFREAEGYIHTHPEHLAGWYDKHSPLIQLSGVGAAPHSPRTAFPPGRRPVHRPGVLPRRQP